jgi:hypothetical protein
MRVVSEFFLDETDDCFQEYLARKGVVIDQSGAEGQCSHVARERNSERPVICPQKSQQGPRRNDRVKEYHLAVTMRAHLR